MQGGGACVEIFSLFAQAKTDVEIHYDADTCREEHDKRLNRLRMLQTLHSFPKNSDGDEDECYRIHERSQDAHTVIAEGLTSVGGPFCLHDGKPCQAKRKNVGDYVSSIGE